jgi:hypothetical protein
MIGCGTMVALVISGSFGLTILVSLWWEKRRVGWSIDCEAVANASCGLFLEMTIATKAGGSLAPSLFCTQGRWGSLLCDGRFHCYEHMQYEGLNVKGPQTRPWPCLGMPPL